MKRFLVLTIVVLFAFSCEKIPANRLRCGEMILSLPKGWSLDFANNDFSTFLTVDSRWSFSPKSWTVHAASGNEAGAEVIATICNVKTKSQLRSFLESSDSPEMDALFAYIDEFSEYYKETLEQVSPDVSVEQLPSGKWYLMSYRQLDAFEDQNNHYLLEGRIKTHRDTLYLILINDFEELMDTNRKKYFNKYLQSIQFLSS